MKPTFFKGAVAGGIAGALCAAATVALAGTGINGIFNLGVDNSVDGQTQLHGTRAAIRSCGSTISKERTPRSECSGAHSAAAGPVPASRANRLRPRPTRSGVFGRITSRERSHQLGRR